MKYLYEKIETDDFLSTKFFKFISRSHDFRKYTCSRSRDFRKYTYVCSEFNMLQYLDSLHYCIFLGEASSFSSLIFNSKTFPYFYNLLCDHSQKMVHCISILQ